MSYVRNAFPILGLALASYGCSAQQVKFSEQVGFAHENSKDSEGHEDSERHQENCSRGKENAVKIIDDKIREDIFKHAVRVDVKFNLSEVIRSSNGLEIEIKSVGKNIGSGVSLCGNYALTAAHVIPEDTLQGMKITERKIILDHKHEAEVEKKDDYHDLALLKVTEASCKKRCLSSYTNGLAEKVEIGDVVAGAGFPLGGEEILFQGFVAGYEIRDREIKFVNIDASSSIGDSGAPVFKMAGSSVKKPYLIGLVQVKYVGENRYMEKSGLIGITPLRDLEEFLHGSKAARCWEDPVFRYRK